MKSHFSTILASILLSSLCFLSFAAYAESGSEYAWKSDPYRAPDYEGFFPNDAEGGRNLEALWKAKDNDSRPDDEIMAAMKQGMRRTPSMPIVRWFGNKYIWGKDPQNPEAIEIMYHLVGGPNRYDAIYFGLSVVQEKTPAILRTLVDVAMKSEDPNVLHRIAWGCSSQKDELLKYLDPYLNDPETREHAEVLSKIFRGELKAFEWSREKTRAKAEAEFTGQLPEIKEALLHGDTEKRTATLNLIDRNGITLIMDDSFIPAWAAAAADPDVELRRKIARTFGNAWLWTKKEQNPEAVDLIMEMTKDPDREVRSRALYFGLSVIWDPSDEVLERLVEMALEDQEPNWYDRALWGLRRTPSRVEPILMKYIEGYEDEPGQAAIALDIYRKILDKDPPVGNIDKLEQLRKTSRNYVIAFVPTRSVESESDLLKEFKSAYQGSLESCRLAIRSGNNNFSGVLIVPSWDAKEAVKSVLEKNDKFNLLQVEEINSAQVNALFQENKDWLAE